MNTAFTNRLAKETSPYLLQHAHNPVDWYPWGEEAFAKAKAENKPVLVSIGYSTCHWCHVMERESFENEETAAFMNEHFVNIKVDREERPDVDQVYMEVIQAISGSGGWPLNCFLTPERKAFYGGTYFPPEPAYKRPSWRQVLSNILSAFQQKREVVESQAERLLESIKSSDGHFFDDKLADKKQGFNRVQADNTFFGLKERFDTMEGGFGSAPKFPNSMNLRYLLHYGYYTGSEEALSHLYLSLDKMIMGGIYDQIAGGFARYATDSGWLVPHFEKMLYDNALLVSLLSDTYKFSAKEIYKETVEETLEFVLREMTSEEGGFYAALDADSEGEEGKYYVWEKKELELLLGDDFPMICDFYGVCDRGNWEGKTIFWRRFEKEAFAKKYDLTLEVLNQKLAAVKTVLFTEREKRIRPGLDDKILLDWNALQCSAFAKAYQALGEEKYKDAAIKNIDFLLDKFKKDESGGLWHTYKEGEAKYDAFLNDYAYLIEALIEVYEISFEEKYLAKAAVYTEYVLNHFWDTEKGNFFFTSSEQKDALLRKKDMFDGAMPSGNGMMVGNMQRLSLLLDKAEWREKAQWMLGGMSMSVERHSTSFGLWALGLLHEVFAPSEIAILGKEALSLAEEVNSAFIPNKVLMASLNGEEEYPLLANRNVEEATQLYLCRDYSCKQPVYTVAELLDQIEK